MIWQKCPRAKTDAPKMKDAKVGEIIRSLTAIQVKNAKPKEKTYRMFDGGGLYLEVTPAGSKLWRMKFRQANGKENRLAFGKYPDVSLEQARKKRDEARSLKAAGIDPGENKKAKKAADAEAASNTLEKIAREWHANRLETWTPQTAKDILNRLEKDIFPEIGSLPIHAITHKLEILIHENKSGNLSFSRKIIGF